jgi:hypothetical protein
MRTGLRSVPGYLVGSIALASLAFLPSSAWSAARERQADRSKDKPQAQAQTSRESRQAAPARTDNRPEQSRGSVPAPAAAARAGRVNVPAPAPPQARPAPAPAQTPAPRTIPGLNSRQFERVGAPSPAAPVARRAATPDQGRAAVPAAPALRPVPARERPAPVARVDNARPAAPPQVSESAPRPARPDPEESPAPSPTRTRPAAPRPSPESRGHAVVPAPAARPAPPVAAARRLAVPEASFRGAGSEAQVRTIAPSERTLTTSRFQDWVREQNHRPGRPATARPAVDVVGNVVPTMAAQLTRSTPGYHRLVSTLGAPRFSYVVAPGAVWGGGFFSAAHRHHTVVLVDLYYPFYFTDPAFVGFHYTGYYPSVYCYLGWSPGWIFPERVYYAPADYVYTVPGPYSYALDERGAYEAIADVRRTWLDGDIGPLASHLTDQLDIRVYFEGEYSYTTTTDDFYAMTLDALATVDTLAMDFDEPIWISSREVFYTGRQVFDDPDGIRHVVYVSFRFRKLGSEWCLVAIGSSQDPIQHQYTDFRTH